MPIEYRDGIYDGHTFVGSSVVYGFVRCSILGRLPSPIGRSEFHTRVVEFVISDFSAILSFLRSAIVLGLADSIIAHVAPRRGGDESLVSP